MLVQLSALTGQKGLTPGFPGAGIYLDFPGVLTAAVAPLYNVECLWLKPLYFRTVHCWLQILFDTRSLSSSNSNENSVKLGSL